MPDVPLIQLEPEGRAPIISYNVPQPSSYSGVNVIELEVTRFSGSPTGDWCIAFAEPIPLERRQGAVVSPAVISTEVLVINATRSFDCAGGIRVLAVTPGGSLARDAHFSFIVP